MVNVLAVRMLQELPQRGQETALAAPGCKHGEQGHG